MWTIQQISEADYGCEERLPGEPLMVLVTLESDIGEILQFEMPDNWLLMQGLDEGDRHENQHLTFGSLQNLYIPDFLAHYVVDFLLGKGKGKVLGHMT